MCNEGNVKRSVTASLEYQSRLSHCYRAFNNWKTLLGAGLAAFSALLTFLAAVTAFLESEFLGWRFLITSVVFAFVIGMIAMYRAYLRDYPACVAGRSRTVKRIVHMQYLGWDYQLCYQLMTEDVIPLSHELDDIRFGRAFVPSVKCESIPEYLDWSRNRLYNLEKLIAAAQHLLVVRYSEIVQSGLRGNEKAMEIIQYVAKVRRLYRSIIALEEANAALKPPETFHRVHEILCTWTDPVREAICQFVQWHQIAVDELSEGGLRELSLVFSEPADSAEANSELQRIAGEISDGGI